MWPKASNWFLCGYAYKGTDNHCEFDLGTKVYNIHIDTLLD